MSIDLLPEQIRENYDVEERYHACAVLHTDFPAEWTDLIAALQDFRLTKTMVTTRGGNKGPIARRLDGFFYERGWGEHRFKVEVRVDGVLTLTPTHHVDYFRNRVAVETEWNNKDPFFDRDLTTFRLLFDLNALNVVVSRKQDHSRKPRQVYEIIERCSPGPFLELFARDPRRGWTQWGDEVPAVGDIKTLHAVPFIIQPDEEEPTPFYEQRVLTGIR